MAIAAIVGYLLGSIPVAVLVARAKGLDPRERGDRNPGWWNMRGLVGERTALLVLVGDVLKGAAAAVVGVALWGPWWVPYVAVAFAMIGHAFPAFGGFRGGRSVLTFVGGMLVINPVPALISIGIGVVVSIAARHRVWGPRAAMFVFPFVQAFFVPRAHVATTGVLMTFIGLRFLLAGMSDRARNEPAATSSR